jgi:hypothetical protein
MKLFKGPPIAYRDGRAVAWIALWQQKLPFAAPSNQHFRALDDSAPGARMIAVQENTPCKPPKQS